jgi:hypothetical protein
LRTKDHQDKTGGVPYGMIETDQSCGFGIESLHNRIIAIHSYTCPDGAVLDAAVPAVQCCPSGLMHEVVFKVYIMLITNESHEHVKLENLSGSVCLE